MSDSTHSVPTRIAARQPNEIRTRLFLVCPEGTWRRKERIEGWKGGLPNHTRLFYRATAPASEIPSENHRG